MPRISPLLALAALAAAAACDRAPTGPGPAPLAAPEFAAANQLSGDTLSWTDFAEYAPGTQPADWSTRWDPTAYFSVADEPSATGGRVLQWSATGQSRNRWGLAYDGLGDRTDQSVYTEFRVRSLGGGASVYYMGAAAVRMSGTESDERGYAVYFVTAPSSGAKAVVLSTWSGGAYVQLGSHTTDWQLDQWYAVRLEAVGSTIRARFWPRGTAEPATWQLSAADTRYPAGRPGVSHHDNGTVQWDTWEARAAATPLPPPVAFTTFTAFLGGVVWAAPAGWSQTSAPENSAWMVAADLSFNDGRALRNVNTATGRHILRPMGIPDTIRDQEALIKLRMADLDDRGPGVVLRHSMGGSGATGYVAYFRPGLDRVEINRFLNGVWMYVGSAPFPNDPGAWYWMRFRAEGTALLLRAWADGQPEPAGWMVTSADTGIPSGAVGLYTYEPNTVDYDLGSFASGGLTAPMPTPGSPPQLAAVHTTPATATIQTSAPLQVGAYGRLTSNDSVFLAPAWTTSGGTLSPTGVFTSATPGTFQVVGTYGGKADTTLITVVTPPPGGSTSFATLFQGTAGTAPSPWTATSAPAGVSWLLAADAGAADGQVLRAVSTTTGRHILQLDELAEATDQEALTLLRMSDADERGPGLAVRHRMSGTSESAYVAYLRPNANTLEINRFMNGAWMFVSSVPFVNDPGVWYWVRFRAEGTTLRARVWAAGTPEPATWQVTATDNGLATGRTGVYVYEPNSVDFDAFAAVNGTGSAPAP